MASARSDFLAGARDSVPALPANVPFGVIAGVAAVNVGFSAVEGVVLSAFAFAGAAQLAALDLLAADAPLAVVVGTALVVNLRYVMYSASIAPYFEELRTRWKLALSFFLLDVTFAISVTEFDRDSTREREWYYLGLALPLWSSWVAATALGIVAGARVPPGWNLDFAVPLLFVGLLAPAVVDRATGVAAVLGGVVAVAGAGIPLDLGLIVGAVVGVAAGYLVEGVN